MITVWCIGMYSSASTWMYNLVRTMMESVLTPEEVAAAFVAATHDVEGLVAEGKRGIVGKTHLADKDLLVDMRNVSGAKAVITRRDPRDCVASQMEQGESFDAALHMAAHSSATCRRAENVFADAFVFRYEDDFAEDPATIDTLDAGIGLGMPASARREAFLATRRSSIEQYIRESPAYGEDIIDMRTHWHTKHAGRDGRIGKWCRILTPEQADIVTAATAV